jgi:hypothetical protein
MQIPTEEFDPSLAPPKKDKPTRSFAMDMNKGGAVNGTNGPTGGDTELEITDDAVGA